MSDASNEIKNTLLEPHEIIDFVNTNYRLEQPLSCEFIRRGFNDHYKIMAGKTDYIFRVYLSSKYYIQSSDDFLFELELLEFLHARGVPVASPIRRQDNGVLGQLENRSAALFPFAPGSTTLEEAPSPARCLNLGKAIAAFHLASNDFASKYHRYHLNLEYLVDRPLEMIEKHGNDEFKAHLQTLLPVDDLIAFVKTLANDGDTYGIIHGDLHPGNMHFTEDDRVTLFDFDHCAYGWRTYDLWLTAFLPEAQREALLQGYETVRPLTEEERSSIAIFAKLRGIWDMGDYLTVGMLKKKAQ